MWAMIPMLRVRARGYSRIASPFPPFLTSCSVVVTCIISVGLAAISGTPGQRKPAPGGGLCGSLPSPAIVRERLVGLGHLVHVLAPLHRGAGSVRSIHDLGDEAFGHGVL